MTPITDRTIDPALDLVLERVIDVPPELVWRAWTEPDHLVRWFTPAPWSTAECEIDLRPGGIFRTVMRSPEGTLHPHVGCYLEVVPLERVVWTVALEPGFRPARDNGDTEVPAFTAVITLEPHGSGTKYTAIAKHRDERGAEQHASMGFHDGWGAALDQLVAYARTL